MYNLRCSDVSFITEVTSGVEGEEAREGEGEGVEREGEVEGALKLMSSIQWIQVATATHRGEGGLRGRATSCPAQRYSNEGTFFSEHNPSPFSFSSYPYYIEDNYFHTALDMGFCLDRY